MEVVGGVSGVITVITSVTKLAKNLNEIREGYNNVALNTTLVASHLTTISFALEAIAEWRKGAANDSSQSSKRLDEDLALSLNCCAILITVIDSKLGQSAGMKAKIRHLWLEDVLKEYLSNLDGQVRALQLLLTIFQCRTATEQSQKRQEHRTAIEQLRAETASLQTDSREHYDAASMLSMDPSVNLEVDSILLKHPAYRKVYGHYVQRSGLVSPPTQDEPHVLAPVAPSETPSPAVKEVPQERHYQHRLQQLDGTAFGDCKDVDARLVSRNEPHLHHASCHEPNSIAPSTHEKSHDIEKEQGGSVHVNDRSNGLGRDEPAFKEMGFDLLSTGSGLGVDFTKDVFYYDKPTIGARDRDDSSAQSSSQRQQPSHITATHEISQLIVEGNSNNGETSRRLRSPSLETDLYGASIQPRRSIQHIEEKSHSTESDPFDDNQTASSICDINPLSITLESANNNTNNIDTDTEALHQRSPVLDRSINTAGFYTAEDEQPVHLPTVSKPHGQGRYCVSTAPPARSPPLPPVSTDRSSFSPILLSELDVTSKQDYSVSDASINSSKLSASSVQRQSSAASLSPPDSEPPFSQTSLAETIATQPSSTSEEKRHASRERAQMELSRLQQELADAKAVGDNKRGQASLERSIQLIRETYLPSKTPIESPQSQSSSKAKTRSLLRLPSVSSFSRHRKSQAAAAMEAVQPGDKASLRKILDQGMNVNHRYKDFTTLFVQAAVHEHIGCMELLKERGADELAVNDKGQNVLHLAVLAQKPEAVQWLLTAYPCTEDETQGEHRRKSNKTLSISRLLSQHPIRETSDRAGFKPIHTAAYHGLTNMVNILLASGADIEAKNNIGGTPLHTALHSENGAEISKILLSSGANPEAPDAQGMTPLHCVASAGNVDMIHILIGAGAKRRSTYNHLGDLPIHTAVRKGHLPAIEALVTEGTDLEATTAHGDTLLHIAVLTGQTHVVDYLFQRKVNPNPWSQSAPAKLDDHGWMVYSKVLSKRARQPHTQSTTPLHFACFAGNYEMAVLLLDHLALVNAATADGKSPLMLAVESDDTNLVYLLLARGAKVDTRLPDSLLTVMHLASEKGNLETLRILYQHGASIDVRTGDTKSPCDYAMLCKDPVKRKALMEWYHRIFTNRTAQARELNARNRQRVEQQKSQQYSQQNQQHYTMSPQYQLPEQDQIALIRQLSPPYNHFDPVHDSFPEAPPPYVAGPSAPERLARRDPVYRPPN